MNRLIIFICGICFLLSPKYNSGQSENTVQIDSLKILFYNVENYFDCQDDSLPGDDEFLPNAPRRWNLSKFYRKTDQLSKVILASGGFNLPALVGLAEIENQYVLEFLLSHSPLSNCGYRIIHKESPDHRGIDVAVLYRPDMITPIFYDFIPVVKSSGKIMRTREILHVSCRIKSDTIDFFVNHWPSRYDGYAKTEPDRCLAATCLKKQISSILKNRPEAKIVVMGDFNDQPSSKSVLKVLGASRSKYENSQVKLINLTDFEPYGTIKYRYNWQTFDQFIVSSKLVTDSLGWHTSIKDCKLIKFPFLLENDPKYSGTRVFRTYRGYRYEGGFSDHLPIVLTLYKRSF